MRSASRGADGVPASANQDACSRVGAAPTPTRMCSRSLSRGPTSALPGSTRPSPSAARPCSPRRLPRACVAERNAGRSLSSSCRHAARDRAGDAGVVRGSAPARALSHDLDRQGQASRAIASPIGASARARCQPVPAGSAAYQVARSFRRRRVSPAIGDAQHDNPARQ